MSGVLGHDSELDRRQPAWANEINVVMKMLQDE